MVNMKTLYLSDLDGTLLRSDEKISEYSANIINRFIQNGGFFSYATARSFVTASKVTAALNTSFPVICYNGAFIIENTTKKVLLSNYFTENEVDFISETLNLHSVYPIVYAYINGIEQFSYIEKHITPAMQFFLNSRIGDPRHRKVERVSELYQGEVFYISCIDTEVSLSKINDIFKENNYNCISSKDIYSNEHWCEIMPSEATKANAALQLKSMFSCDRMVAFGDGHNDLSLFSVADEKYAVANAVPELKEAATDIIDSNDNDGVAKWLSKLIT